MLSKLLILFCFYSVTAKHLRNSEMVQNKVHFYLNEAKELFDEFIKNFDKRYDNKTEYEQRLRIFTENLEDVNNRNKLCADSETYGITQFLDMTTEEFIRDYTGLRLDTNLNEISRDEPDLQPMWFSQRQVPEHWDWRKEGVVTPVVLYAIKYRKLVTLSEQQLVDCFPEGGSCRTGSLPHYGVNAAARMDGFMTQRDYPYTGVRGYCSFQWWKVAVRVRYGQQLRQIRSEEQLKQLVYEYGPVSIGIAALEGFYKYKGGIASVERLGCEYGPNANHAVLIVGYGTEYGKPYWIIKNSYGTTWGEQGYMRLIRGRNACSILEYVAIAEVV